MSKAYRQLAGLLVGAFLAGCRPQEEKRYFPSGQLKWRVPVDADGLYNGYALHFDTAGAMTSKLPFRHGELEGLAYYYYPTGQLQSSSRFAHGRKNGPTRVFFATGQVKRLKQFRHEVEVGTSLHYYSTGRVRLRVYHNPAGKVVELDAYTPAGQRDIGYTQALVLAVSDTVPAGQSYAFDVVLANALSNAVTCHVTSPGNALDSLSAPARTHRYVVARPRPGANRLQGRLYNRVLRHDTLYKYWFDFQHTFWVRPAKAAK